MELLELQVFIYIMCKRETGAADGYALLSYKFSLEHGAYLMVVWEIEMLRSA